MTVETLDRTQNTLAFNEKGEAEAIASARKLRPLLQKNTQIHHTIGEMTEEVVDAVVAAGFHNLAVPRRWNGSNLSSAALARVSAEIAKGCPSTAWSVSITNSVAWMSSQMKDSMQQKVFANGTPMLTSPQNGMGTLEPVEDGYLLTGRWAYGSNCHHAKYALLTGILDGTQPLQCLVSINDVTRVDTWDVVGMGGTGSDTLVADKVFVPNKHACKMAGVISAEEFSYEKESSDHFVVFPLLRSKALGVLVGTVEGLFDAVVAGGKKPVIYSAFEQRQDCGTYRGYMGEAGIKIRTARTIMDRINDMNDEAALQARHLDMDESHHIRGEVAMAIKLLNEAASTLMDLAGSSGFSASNLAQRYWLDFNVGSRHVIFNPYISFEAFGDYVLGRELAVTDAMTL